MNRADPTYVKARRRAELAAGAGRCAWEERQVAVVASVGDQLGDFPAAGKPLPGAGDDAWFGSRFFLLPRFSAAIAAYRPLRTARSI